MRDSNLIDRRHLWSGGFSGPTSDALAIPLFTEEDRRPATRPDSRLLL